MLDAADIQSFLVSVLSVLRWISLALVLLNYRAFPLVWHVRAQWPIIIKLINMAFIWYRDPRRREFIRKISPLGANPFDLPVVYRTTVGFSDLDYNLHLSNSSYAKNLDIARVRAILKWFPSLLVSGARLGLGASHFHFLKEIPAGAEYEIRINIVGWEEKWIYLVAQFVTYPKQRWVPGAVRLRPFTSASSNASAAENESARKSFPVPPDSSAMITPPSSPGYQNQRLNPDVRRRSSVVSSAAHCQNLSDVEHSASANSTPGTSASPSPHFDSKPLLDIDDLTKIIGSSDAMSSSSSKQSSSDQEYWRSNALPPLPEDAVLHCVHTSSYCFKQGRITIPPSVALIACGFGDREHGRWERVQEIRNTRAQKEMEKEDVGARQIPPATMFTFREPGTERGSDRRTYGGLREIFTGGWRRYEEEGLWVLSEYEERRKLGVERFSPLRLGLLALPS